MEPNSSTPAPLVKETTTDVDACSWTALPKETLESIWLEVTNVGVVLPNQAGAFGEIRVEGSDEFLVVFPSDNMVQRDYCDNEKAKIQVRLSKRLGAKVSLRCVVDPSVKSRVSTPSVPSGEQFVPRNSGSSYGSSQNERRRTPSSEPAISRRASFEPRPTGRNQQSGNFQEMFRQMKDNEYVKQIEEFFEAELTEVKPPYVSNRNQGGGFNR